MLCEQGLWETARKAAGTAAVGPSLPQREHLHTAAEPPSSPHATSSGKGHLWMDTSFCPQHLQHCRNCPSGVGRAHHRLKQLNTLLSLAIRWGLATGWLRHKDTESWHQTFPASLPTFWSYVKRSMFKPAHFSQGIKHATENCPFFLPSTHSCSHKTRRLGKWHNPFTLLQLLNISDFCENNGIWLA